MMFFITVSLIHGAAAWAEVPETAKIIQSIIIVEYFLLNGKPSAPFYPSVDFEDTLVGSRQAGINVRVILR